MQQKSTLETPTQSVWGRVALSMLRAYGGIPFALSVAASSGIVCMIALICADVGMRFIFNAPIGGVNEIVSMLIVVCVFLQLGSTVSDESMIRADFIMQHWRRERPALAEVADAVFFALASVVLMIGTYWLWREFYISYRSDEYVGAVGAYQIITWPFRLGAAVGCTAASIESLRVVARCLVRLVRRPDEPVELFAPIRRDLLPIATFLAGVAVLGFAGFTLDLTPIQIGVLMLAALLASIAIGMPIAFALLCLSFLGVWLIRGDLFIASNSLGTTFSNAIASYEFAVIPLFIIMGIVLEKADIGRDLFQVSSALLRKLPGALGIATVAGNAIFASVAASSVVSASVFSRIAVPPMVENGYTKRFSVGVVAGSSVLGILIPPSIPLIIYGLIAETSIGKLFIATILPGILVAVAFSLLNIGLALFFPRFVGTPREPETGELSLYTVAVKLLPILAIVGVIIGGIYAGVFTPTEAGAVGALAAFAVGAARRRLTFDVIKDIGRQTTYISARHSFPDHHGQLLRPDAHAQRAPLSDDGDDQSDGHCLVAVPAAVPVDRCSARHDSRRHFDPVDHGSAGLARDRRLRRRSHLVRSGGDNGGRDRPPYPALRLGGIRRQGIAAGGLRHPQRHLHRGDAIRHCGLPHHPPRDGISTNYLTLAVTSHEQSPRHHRKEQGHGRKFAFSRSRYDCRAVLLYARC